MIRRDLARRLNKLETRLPIDEGPQKPPFPAWLMEEWEKQGLRFDSLGRPDRESWCAPAGWRKPEASGGSQMSSDVLR